MLYPQNGRIANGSRRIFPTSAALIVEAAVISDPTIEPRNTPWFQLRASCTSGIVEGRRPPKRIALIGTPAGSSQFDAMHGHWSAGAVKRAFGCAKQSDLSFGFLSFSGASRVLPCQSTRVFVFFGAYPMPSHQTSPSSVRAQLVKMVFFSAAFIALKLDSSDVPGA